MRKKIVDPEIVEYLFKVTPERDAVLKEMESLADERNFPIVGPLVGRILYQLVILSQARKIFELGSGFGYSAYWLAKGLGDSRSGQDGGKIFCVEGSEENVCLAREFFKKGGMEDRVDFRNGDALEAIEEEEGPFDIIFNDVDKEQYPEVFRKAVPKLRKGGLLISDNLLWHGEVLSKDPDEATQGIQEFTRLIYDSKELFTTILPVRDGISVSIKI